MAAPEFDIVVIGGGAGGLVVAAGGASLGAKVALVEKHKMGGDCLYYGCVPSKTLIKSARVAHLMRTAQHYAIPAANPKPVITDVMERVAAVIRSIEPHDSPERFRGLGVDVNFGDGTFADAQTFVVNGRRLTAKKFVIATGSRASVPPIPGINETPYLTNETVFDLREPVESLLVIGTGPIGAEMAQAFRRLGTQVTAIDVLPQILPKEDPDLADVVYRQMVADGVTFHLGVSITQAEGSNGNIRLKLKPKEGQETVVAGTHLLIAAGRKPNVEGLALEKAGVQLEKGRIVVDDKLRTTNPNIFVCGDVAGSYQFTHVAGHHAGIILRQAIFKLFWTKPSSHVPWCTYTDPELARIGLSEAEARERNIAYKAYRFPFAELDRARAEGETDGFAKILTDAKGKLLGAAIVGPHAGEIIHEYVLAMNKGMRIQELSNVIHIYPTLSEINKRAADQRLKEGLTPNSKMWIKRIFGLQGA